MHPVLQQYPGAVAHIWDARLEVADRQVILMDRHAEGPLDALWPAVAAGAGPAALTTPISSGLTLPYPSLFPAPSCPPRNFAPS